jgi:peptidoglycan hydrolase-like protein with peptidoglycan-binding domain
MKKLTLAIFACLICATFNLAQTGTDTVAVNAPKNTTTEKTRKKAFRPTKGQIREVQNKLKADGTYNGEADGKYSKDFRQALKTFQEKTGLEKTGRVDEETILKMGIELTDRQKGIEPAKSSKRKRKTFRVTKDQIILAQKLLKEAGLYIGGETGKYSKEFRSAIKDFQSANGLRRRGSLNRSTLEKMRIELTAQQKEVPVNPNNIAKPKDPNAPKRKIFRASKDQITRVQAMLKEKGLYNGEETGKLTPDTRSAIKTWQSQNNMKKTGTLNKETLEAMGIELTAKQKES